MENIKVFIEIIDTSIKIGLGATIGGFSTYFLNKQKNGIDKKKNIFDKQVFYIEQILEKTEEVRLNLSKVSHKISIYSKNKKIDFDFVSAAEIYLDCISLLGQSKSMSILINLKNVNDKFKKTEKIVSRLYEAAIEKKLLEDTTNIKDKTIEYRTLISEIFSSLSNNYNIISSK